MMPLREKKIIAVLHCISTVQYSMCSCCTEESCHCTWKGKKLNSGNAGEFMQLDYNVITQ